MKYCYFLLFLLLLSCSDSNFISKISIDRNQIVVHREETAQLSAICTPRNIVSDLIWESSDESVVMVSGSGKDAVLYARSVGVATITVKSYDNYNVSSSCKVIIKEKLVEEIKLDEEDIHLFPGDSDTLHVACKPSDIITDIIWTTSDSDVVIVSDGIVKALKPGKAKIMAKAGDGSSCYAECNVIVNPFPPKIGDYYYDDGTYSSELNHNKEVIGIVFYTGDPSKFDKKLSEDHPNCSNGLVLSLKGVKSAWQKNFSSVGAWVNSNLVGYQDVTTGTGSSDNLNKIVGYNNTKAIEAYNKENESYKVNAVDLLEDFRDDNPVPSSSSGWYLPSAKEISLFITGEYNGNIYTIPEADDSILKLINERLSELEGAEPLSNSYYWSSSEYDKSLAFHFLYAALFFHKDEINEVRFVLAF